MTNVALKTSLSSAVLSLLLVSVAAGQASSTAKLRAELRDMVRRHVGLACPAAALAVVRDNAVLIAEPAGIVRRGEPDRRVDAATQFPLGSSTRLLTRLLTERLAASDGLELDVPIDAAVGFPVKRPQALAAVTLRDFVDGRYSLPHYVNQFPAAAASRWTLDGLLRDHFVPSPSPARHGARSALVDAALQRFITVASDSGSWNDVMKARLGAPLGLTSLAASPEHAARRVGLHRSPNFGAPTPEPCTHSDIAAHDGAWLSAADLGRLVAELVRRAAPVQTDTPLDTSTNALAALGFASSIEGTHEHIVLDGRRLGSRSRIEIYPNLGIGIAVITTASAAQPSSCVDTVRALVLPPSDTWCSTVGLSNCGIKSQQSTAPAWCGTWSGELVVRGRRLPLLVTLRADATATVRSGDHAEVTNPTYTGQPGTLRFFADTAIPIRRDQPVTASIELTAFDGDQHRASAAVTFSSEACAMSFTATLRRQR